MCVTNKTASAVHYLRIQHTVRQLQSMGLNALDKVGHVTWRLNTCKRYDRLDIESIAQIDHFAVDKTRCSEWKRCVKVSEGRNSHAEDGRAVTCQLASRTMVPSRLVMCSPSAHRLSVGTLAVPSIFAIRSSSRLQVCHHCDLSRYRTRSYLLHAQCNVGDYAASWWILRQDQVKTVVSWIRVSPPCLMIFVPICWSASAPAFSTGSGLPRLS